MRLLNTFTLEFRELCYEVSIPEYAILSHCWSNKEVTFSEVKDGRPEVLNSSWTKLLSFCARARMDLYEYAWIDTCCIDKASSAELSEAINSMFQWYQKASKCYVYLEDVEHDGTDSSSMDTFIDDFRYSKWFTRGWTLQELIAPREVHFFNRSWKSLGGKSQLKQLLHRATGISETILDHTSHVVKADIFTKISWVKGRETRRSEDLAYSLLGIFDVNMPPIYGEGIKALFRLQEEILRTVWPSAIGSAASQVVLRVRRLFNDGRLRTFEVEEETDASCIWSEFAKVLEDFDFSNGLWCHKNVVPHNMKIWKSVLAAELLERSECLHEDPLVPVLHILQCEGCTPETCMAIKNPKKRCGSYRLRQQNECPGKLRRLEPYSTWPNWVPQYTTTDSHPKTELEALPFHPVLRELEDHDLCIPVIDDSLVSSPELQPDGYQQVEPPASKGGDNSKRIGRTSSSRFLCDHCSKSFSRPRDRDRHVADIHVQTGIYYMCGSCDYGSKRKDKVLAHCRRMHGHDLFNLTNNDRLMNNNSRKQPLQSPVDVTEAYIGTDLVDSSNIFSLEDFSSLSNSMPETIDFGANDLSDWSEDWLSQWQS